MDRIGTDQNTKNLKLSEYKQILSIHCVGVGNQNFYQSANSQQSTLCTHKMHAYSFVKIFPGWQTVTNDSDSVSKTNKIFWFEFEFNSVISWTLTHLQYQLYQLYLQSAKPTFYKASYQEGDVNSTKEQTTVILYIINSFVSSP